MSSAFRIDSITRCAKYFKAAAPKGPAFCFLNYSKPVHNSGGGGITCYVFIWVGDRRHLGTDQNWLVSDTLETHYY